MTRSNENALATQTGSVAALEGEEQGLTDE